jgi:2OG-Fe(II) oxygenase superfamily
MKEAKEIHKGITLYEDFLTDEECEHVLSFARSLSNSEWKDLYTKNTPHAQERDGKGQDPFWADKVAELNQNDVVMNRINERVRQILPEGEWHTTLNRVQRQYTGTALPRHYDATHSDKLIGAVILYLNDDYVDGELVFDKLGIEFRPPKRSLLKFLSSEEYSHETNPVGDGPTRYVLATFTWDNEESSWTGH